MTARPVRLSEHAESPMGLAGLRGRPIIDDHDEKAARREWERRWGIKVGTPYLCPARRLTACHDHPDRRGCCWWTGADPRPRAFDHVWNIARRGDGARGILTMPYGLTADDAVELAAWCHAHHATYSVSGEGWHYPGTVAIVLWPVAAADLIAVAGPWLERELTNDWTEQ
jgi:hypothetical protein